MSPKRRKQNNLSPNKVMKGTHRIDQKPETAPDSRLMVMALICLTFRSPNTDIVLVMEGEGLNAPSGYHFVTARDIAIGAELDDFPITEADGVIQALCKFGMEAQEQRIAQRWSVAARRAHYEWEVFHATRAEGT